MIRKLANRILLITLLLGILASSTALGSHVDSSSTSSGPPRILQPQPVKKHPTPIRKTPDPTPAPGTNRSPSSFTEPHSPSELMVKNIQPAKLHTRSGWRLLLNGQTRAAVTAYRQALTQNPNSANAYLGLGISLKGLGEVGLAKKALLKAVDLNPNLPPALVHLGYLYAEGHFGQADLNTARRLFQQASQLGDPFASIALLDMKPHSKL